MTSIVHRGSLARGARRAGSLLRFALSPGSGARYVGWLGHDNLGDEALYLAIQEYFRPVPLAHLSPVYQPAVAAVASLKRHRVSILGGGTLIASGYRAHFEETLSRTRRGIVFGAGVADEVFWSAYPDRKIRVADWRAALERCEYVGVRGPDSVNSLADVGISAEILGDPAAWFVRPPGWWMPDERVLGVNVGQAGGQMWGSEEILIEQVGSLVRRAVAEGWRVEFFVVWPNDLEITIATIAEAQINDAVVHTIYGRPDEYLEQVRRATVFVGTKLHSVILAMCAGVPSIMLEYRPKCRDFMKSVDLDHLNIRVDRIDADTLYEQIVGLLGNASGTSREVTERMQLLKNLQTGRASTLAKNLMSP